MTQQLLDWQRVYAWARQKDPTQIIGTSCTNSACPLAMYLEEQTGVPWSVGPSIRRADKREKLWSIRPSLRQIDKLEKPVWVYHLIEEVDGLVSPHSSQPVTAAQFLAALETVKPEDQ